MSNIGSFRAFRIDERDRQIVAGFQDLRVEDLSPGEVLIRVRYSSINYKDALAATGAGRILRSYPLNGGIDLSGEVVESSDPRWSPGQAVLVTGCGLSETVDGGYSQYARVAGSSVIPLPPGLSLEDVMILGTAGFTAALAVHRMEHNGQQPDKGPVLVTGASGGVGSIAVNMLAGRGYEVVAVSGKPEADAFLLELGRGADPAPAGHRPRQPADGEGALGRRDRQRRRRHAHLAHAHDRLQRQHRQHRPRRRPQSSKTTVMPFILRGVNLLGINSSATPRPTRVAVWERIATDLQPAKLQRICARRVGFAELARAVRRLHGRQGHGPDRGPDRLMVPR